MDAFSVSGSRPPSVAALRPSSSTSFYATPRKVNKGHTYDDDIYERTSSHHSAYHNGSIKSGTVNKTRTSAPRIKKFTESYADEALFGPKCAEPSWDAPWGDSNKGKERPFVFDTSNHRPRTGETRGSRPSVKTSMNGSYYRPGSGRVNHKPSFVDETLFGSSKNITDEGALKSQSYKFETKDYKIGAKKKPPKTHMKGFYSDQGNYFIHEAPMSPGSRPVRLSVAPSETKKNRNVHNPSFVDESLFGPKLDNPDFPAPWEDDSKPPRKILSGLFEAADYKVKVFPSNEKAFQEKPRWKPQRPTSARQAGAKPVWK